MQCGVLSVESPTTPENRQSTVECVICGQPVEGRLEYVRVTLLCVRCCLSRCKNDEGCNGCLYSVSKTYALEECGCSEDDLARLKHLSLAAMSDGSKEPQVMCMYLRAEVWYLRNLRRKKKLEETLCFALKDVDPVVRHFLIGDYLTEMTQCKTTFESIKERRCVLRRVKNILEACKVAHPEAVFEFCVNNPGAGLTRFLNLKRKMQQVFQLEGPRILHELPKDDLERLNEGPLADVYEEFKNRDTTALLRGYLTNWFSKAIVDKIMTDPGWKSRSWAKGPEDRVASELKAFWKGKLERRAKLKAALKQKWLSLPTECSYCESYLNGVGDYALKEVVAIVDLQRRLKKKGIEISGPRGDAGIGELTRCMNRLELGHYVSVSRGFDVAVKYIESESEEDDDDADIF